MKVLKFTVNTPLSHCDQVRKAIGDAGAGKINGYSHCSFSVRGQGRSIPSDKSRPYIGTTNKMEVIDEEKIESFCEPKKFDEVVEAIKDSHPYQEPAISFWEVEII